MSSLFRLQLNFFSKGVYPHIINNNAKNLFFISPASLSKIIFNKSSYKRKKPVVALSGTILRKLFISLKHPAIELTLRGLLINLDFFFKNFFKVIIKTFRNPFSNFDEKDKGLSFFCSFIILKKISFYTKMKQKKRGSIKRKLYKNIIRKNLIDFF